MAALNIVTRISWLESMSLLMMTVSQFIFFAVAIGSYGLLAFGLILRLLGGVLPDNHRLNQKKKSAGRKFTDLFSIRKLYRTEMALLPLLIVMPATVLCGQNTSSSAEALTLEQAIALSLRENHRVKNAERAVGKSEDELSVVFAGQTLRISLSSIASV